MNVLSIGQSATARSVSCVVEQIELASAVRAVHSAFDFSPPRASVFVLGAGVVGGCLLRELNAFAATSEDLELVLVGVATSRRLAFDAEGVDDWRQRSRPGVVDGEMLDRLARCPRPILVDCTAASGMEALYEAALDRGVHVVVANKKALSAPQAIRDRLLRKSREAHRAVRYETTVGAALPVIATLHELLETGDSVHRIEGSLSGSLGFVCEQLNAGVPVDVAVAEARERGYTEPRPQEDLGGVDAARKALILARELGLELEDVELTPLVEASLLQVDEVDAFLEALSEARGAIAAWVDSHRESGARLRYLAVVDPGADPVLKVGPAFVRPGHPAFSLLGSQSLVAFHTRRYTEHPLVVQGAGAGGEVTASGVLGDVLRVCRRRSSGESRAPVRAAKLGSARRMLSA